MRVDPGGALDMGQSGSKNCFWRIVNRYHLTAWMLSMGEDSPQDRPQLYPCPVVLRLKVFHSLHLFRPLRHEHTSEKA